LCYDDLDEILGDFPALRAEVSSVGWWSLIRVPTTPTQPESSHPTRYKTRLLTLLRVDPTRPRWQTE
jgi:hypothetical protein